MAESRDAWQWNHTSELLAAAYNSMPFRSGKPIMASKFNPYKQQVPAPLPKIKAQDIAKFFQV